MQLSIENSSQSSMHERREVRPVNLSAITSEFVELQVRAHQCQGLDGRDKARQELLRSALMLGEKRSEIEPICPEGKIKVRMQDGERICDQQIERIDEGMFDARLRAPVILGARMVVLVESGPGRPAMASYAVAVAPSIGDPQLMRFRLEKE